MPEAFVRGKGTEGRQILDLRTMTAHVSGRDVGIAAHPNPAEQAMRLVVTTSGNGEAPDDTPTRLVVTDQLGAIMLEAPCRSVDVHHLDVSAWPTGAYRAVVASADGVVCSTAFLVLR